MLIKEKVEQQIRIQKIKLRFEIIMIRNSILLVGDLEKYIKLQQEIHLITEFDNVNLKILSIVEFKVALLEKISAINQIDLKIAKKIKENGYYFKQDEYEKLFEILDGNQMNEFAEELEESYHFAEVKENDNNIYNQLSEQIRLALEFLQIALEDEEKSNKELSTEMYEKEKQLKELVDKPNAEALETLTIEIKTLIKSAFHKKITKICGESKKSHCSNDFNILPKNVRT